MRMHVRDRLARRSPVLNRHRQRRGPEHALQHLSDAPDREEQIGCLSGSEVAESADAGGGGGGAAAAGVDSGGVGGVGSGCVSGDRAERADECMAGQNGLEVDEGVRVGGCVKDLNVGNW